VSALAGYLDLAGEGRAPDYCRSMLEALGAYGGNRTQWGREWISLGCLADDILAEDARDTQPLVAPDQRLAIIFDGRIDNRPDLAASLEIEAARLAAPSDARLLLEGWRRWAMGLLDRLVGDFAIAVWDARERRLTLARGPLSTRPIFYHRDGRSVAFASMPSAIAGLPTISKSLNWDAVAALASGTVYRRDRATLFQGIAKVLPGEAVEFRGGDMRSIEPWDLSAISPRPASIEEFGEALRETLDVAVMAQLRRGRGKVASHLSAGRDSSAVTATAALALATSGEELIALTAAPRAGFADGAGHDWLIDESDLAAATAQAHANIRHQICRPDGDTIMDQLDELHRHHFAPIMNLSNMPWSIQLTRTAAEQGASVLLSGANGNFSISNGGDGYLIDLFREEGLGAWWRQADRASSDWLKLAHQLVAPWLPRPVYQALRQVSRRATPASEPLPTLARPLRDRAEAIRAEHFRDWRPPRSYRELVKQTLAGIDDAQKFPSALWGVDVRDPTSDRRVIELCLSLPASAMFSGDSDRPVYEAAFADRLPRQVLRNRQRGYQCADWFERFSAERLRDSFRCYLGNPLVREIVDQQYVEQQLDRWPRTGWQDSIVEPYRNQLMGTLAIASFVDTHFPR
jgi:asparagine synthase (glutamine-hydrolysing)